MISIFRDNTFQLPPLFLCTQKKIHTPQPCVHGSSLSLTDTTPNCFVPRSDLHSPLSMPLFMLSLPLQCFCPVPPQPSSTFALKPCPHTRPSRAPPAESNRHRLIVPRHLPQIAQFLSAHRLSQASVFCESLEEGTWLVPPVPSQHLA